MTDLGSFPATGTVRFERSLPGPIERVWAYLTNSEKRGRWLAKGEMDLRVGGKVELNFNHTNLAAPSGQIPEKYKQDEAGSTTVGRITRCEPPTVLSYTWQDKPGEESEVTFELTPQEGRVLLVLTHRRLKSRDDIVGTAGGWHAHLGILSDLLSGRESPPFWPTHEKLEAEYEKVCK